jgi:hypothetical protein
MLPAYGKLVGSGVSRDHQTLRAPSWSSQELKSGRYSFDDVHHPPHLSLSPLHHLRAKAYIALPPALHYYTTLHYPPSFPYNSYPSTCLFAATVSSALPLSVRGKMERVRRNRQLTPAANMVTAEPIERDLESPISEHE